MVFVYYLVPLFRAPVTESSQQLADVECICVFLISQKNLGLLPVDHALFSVDHCVILLYG